MFWQIGPKQVIRTITMLCMALWLTTKFIYHSELYKKLSTESTKYWHLGPVDLYAELKTEL